MATGPHPEITMTPPTDIQPTWTRIILTMLVTGLGVGLVLGALQQFLDWHGVSAAPAIGASVGVIGGSLIAQRRKAQAERAAGLGKRE
jgi:hypothetical protein